MISSFVLLGLGALAPPPAYDTTFVVPPGARIVIEHREGDITVMASRGREARVLIDGEDGAAHVRISNDAVRISARDPWGDEHGDLVLWVPDDVDLSIQGLDGDVSVTDVRGAVTVATVDGDVQVAGAARVRIDTVDGEVDLADIAGPVTVAMGDGDAWVDGVSGNIDIQGIDGDIIVLDGDTRSLTLSTVSGDVWYDGAVYEDGEYSLGTHDGDITFTLPEGIGAQVAVSTFDGSLRPSFPIQFRGGRVRGAQFTIGDGSAKVALNAFDGDIFLIRPGERSPRRN